MDELIDEYIEQTAKSHALKEQLKEVSGRLGELERELVDRFLATGTESVKRNGRTVYRRRDMTVKTIDRERVVDYFLGHGAKGLVSVNAQTLASWALEKCFNEQLNDWEASPLNLPEEIRDAVEIGERYSISVLGGKKQ